MFYPQYHPNIAPFLAIRFAQRFGISNPSPRYVEVIATSFRRGRYTDENGETFGTGEYGNLAATFAAVILDREARSVVLEADPTFGSVLEPLLRYVRLLKSLEFEAAIDAPFVVLNDMQELVGEEPHGIQSVFSFFLPEYQPLGMYRHRRRRRKSIQEVSYH